MYMKANSMKNLFMIFVANLVAIMITSSAFAVYEERKAELEAQGLRLAILKQDGCRSEVPVGMGINIKGGNVIGAVYTSSRNNTPEMTSKAIKFVLPIRGDGTFGSEDEDFSRYWLRNDRRGDKFQWLSGTVTDTEIKIKLTYGIPGHSRKVCFAAGSITK